MDKSTFRITISGEGVLPETTPVGDLAEFLTNIEKAICETGKGQGVEVGEEEIISLTGVERSSNKLTFAVAGALVSSVAIVSEAVDTSRYEMLPRRAHEALHEVSKQTVKRKWEVRFNKQKKKKGVRLCKLHLTYPMVYLYDANHAKAAAYRI